MMKSRFDWRAAYFHVVSLVAVIVFIVAAIGAGHGILRLALPTLSMNQYDWERAESFEAYQRHPDARAPRRVAPRPVEPPDSIGEQTQPVETEEDLRKDWQDTRNLLIQGERRRGLWSLIQSMVTLIIVLPIFWWHRRSAKRLRDDSEEDKKDEK